MMISWDLIVSFSFQLMCILYTIWLCIKMTNSKITLLSTKLIVTSLLSSLGFNILFLIYTIYCINNIIGNIGGILLSVAIAFYIVQCVSYLILLDRRNTILVEDNRVFTASRILLTITIPALLVSDVTFWAYVPTSNTNYFGSSILLNAANISSLVTAIGLGIYDCLSSFYLLNYYYIYFFKNAEMMKYWGFQMSSRRNWILLVMFCDIASILIAIFNALPQFSSESTGYVWQIIILFQINTMIGFVKYDVTKHEVTLPDGTKVAVSQSSSESESNISLKALSP